MKFNVFELNRFALTTPGALKQHLKRFQKEIYIIVALIFAELIQQQYE